MKETEFVTFEAGKYYVGDLCYVLGDTNGYDWVELLEQTDYLQSESGVFKCHGVTFFCSATAFGDGCYPDNEGRTYGVDAGIIGCFPMSGLGESPEVYGGHIVEFTSAFPCFTCDDDGVIEIGRLSIQTNPQEE